MKYTFKMPLTGEIAIEGSEEDIRSFIELTRIAFMDAYVYNYKYAKCPTWSERLAAALDCLPDPSPYADPTLNLPF